MCNIIVVCLSVFDLPSGNSNKTHVSVACYIVGLHLEHILAAFSSEKVELYTTISCEALHLTLYKDKEYLLS